MSDDANSRPLRSLYRNLLGLFAAVYAGGVVLLWQEALNNTKSDLVYTNTMAVQSLRTNLAVHEQSLRSLGTELLERGVLEQSERGRELIERMQRVSPMVAGIGLARPDGQLLLVSGVAGDQPLPNIAESAQTASTFRETLQSDTLRTGIPYFFEPLNEWVLPIRVAVRDNGAAAKLVMAAGYRIGVSDAIWNGVSMPEKVSVVLVGDDGMLRYMHPLPGHMRGEALQEKFHSPIAAALFDAFGRQEASQGFFSMQLEGRGYYVSFVRVPEYALVSSVTIPRSAVVQKWLDRLVLPTLLFAMLLPGGYLAYRSARHRQQSASRAIRELDAWQRALLDGASYSIISSDVNGTVVSFNEAASRMLGYRPEEVIGKCSVVQFHLREELEARAEILSRESGEVVEPGVRSFFDDVQKDGVDDREWTYVRKDGSTLPVHLSITALRGEDGQTMGYVGIAEDLTEKQAMRTNLHDSEARYRTLFECAGDAIFIMQGECFVDCNPATLRLFRCTRSQILGVRPHQISPEFQPDGQLSSEKAGGLVAAALSGETRFFEWRHRRMDGTCFDAEVTLTSMRLDANQMSLLATVRDISARKRSEAELAASRQTLIERNESLHLLNLLSRRLQQTFAMEDILQETIVALTGMASSPRVAIYLTAEDGEMLALMASHGFDIEDQAHGTYQLIEDGLTSFAIGETRPVFIPDMEQTSQLKAGVQDALIAAGYASCSVIPLLDKGVLLGSISLIYHERHEFDAIERETLSALGTTVALAVTNARNVESLAYQARHDSLTGLPNRTLLHESFERYVAQGKRGVSLLLLDLNRFKEINDTLGHHVGDQVLILLGQRLEQACSGERVRIARLGGDEFAILHYATASTEAATELAQRVVDALQQPVPVSGVALRLGASIGVATYPQHGRDSHALLRAADVAMYQAKHRSLGVTVYDPSFDEHSPERLALANELTSAVQGEQLVLHYQPKIDVTSGEMVGMEALVRWQHTRHGLLYPAAFIDLVEMSEVIHPFTMAVIRQAVSDKCRMHELGYSQPVAINLSARNLSDARCIDYLDEQLRAHGLPATEIELELTETAVMEDADNAATLLQGFHDMGVSIAIDDFGTGYSSLAYLRRMPINALKIDRSFVQDMCDNRQDSSIVESTINLAHNLGLLVIAEGVEDERVLEMLRGMGCDQAQGYGICRPQPLDSVLEWLAARD